MRLQYYYLPVRPVVLLILQLRAAGLIVSLLCKAKSIKIFSFLQILRRNSILILLILLLVKYHEYVFKSNQFEFQTSQSWIQRIRMHMCGINHQSSIIIIQSSLIEQVGRQGRLTGSRRQQPPPPPPLATTQQLQHVKESSPTTILQLTSSRRRKRHT